MKEPMFGKFIMERKIGALELIIVLLFLELFFGTRLMMLILLVGGVGFLITKLKFGGEFSLAQLVGLFGDSKKDQEKIVP